MNKKIMVDQEQIKNALRTGVKVYTIFKRMDIPMSVIRDIKNGKNRLFFRKKVKDKNNICTCCGFRKKMPGAKYLCFVCFSKFSEDCGDNEHQILT